jgi:hypothetical protein
MRYRLEATAHARGIFDTALASAAQPQPRLADLRAMYAWFETQIAELLAQRTAATPNPDGRPGEAIVTRNGTYQPEVVAK